MAPWDGLCPGQANYLPLLPQGKVFPKLRKRGSTRSVDVDELGTGWATDYVFRIIYPGHRHEHSECPMLPLWREKDASRVGENSIAKEGQRARSTDQAGSGLSLSLDLFLQIIPPENLLLFYLLSFPSLVTPRLLAQLTQVSLHNILLVIHSHPALGDGGRECGRD